MATNFSISFALSPQVPSIHRHLVPSTFRLPARRRFSMHHGASAISVQPQWFHAICRRKDGAPQFLVPLLSVLQFSNGGRFETRINDLRDHVRISISGHTGRHAGSRRAGRGRRSKPQGGSCVNPSLHLRTSLPIL